MRKKVREGGDRSEADKTTMFWGFFERQIASAGKDEPERARKIQG